MSRVRRRLREQRAEYGIDGGLNAVSGLTTMGLGGLALLAVALTRAGTADPLTTASELVGGLLLLQVVASYLYSTRQGKLAVWLQLLASLHLQGEERALDMGCGRGAVLAILTRLVPNGRVVGLDLWRAADQTGNNPDATRRNLRAEGVAGRCELLTGDMTAMPFRNAAFDLVVSSLAIHNVRHAQGRLKAVDEAVRVLKPGGRLLIADLGWTRAYANRLRSCGMQDVTEQRPGWRFWFGTLGLAAGVVTATKAD